MARHHVPLHCIDFRTLGFASRARVSHCASRGVACTALFPSVMYAPRLAGYASGFISIKASRLGTDEKPSLPMLLRNIDSTRLRRLARMVWIRQALESRSS